MGIELRAHASHLEFTGQRSFILHYPLAFSAFSRDTLRLLKTLDFLQFFFCGIDAKISLRVKFDQQLHSVFLSCEKTKWIRAIKLVLAAEKVLLLIKLINKLRAKLFLIFARAKKAQNKIRIFEPSRMKPTTLYVDY